MTLGVTLFAVLLLVIALLVWQHARRDGPQEVVLGIANAVSFVEERIDRAVLTRLGRDDIRRIIEWEVFYLQGLAQKDRRQPVEAIAGDFEPAVEFIRHEVERSHQRSLRVEDIGAVLALVAAYLQFIGAMGDEAEGVLD